MTTHSPHCLLHWVADPVAWQCPGNLATDWRSGNATNQRIHNTKRRCSGRPPWAVCYHRASYWNSWEGSLSRRFREVTWKEWIWGGGRGREEGGGERRREGERGGGGERRREGREEGGGERRGRGREEREGERGGGRGREEREGQEIGDIQNQQPFNLLI